MAYTDMEQHILDMWPKFEDGSYVQLGDSYIDTDIDENEVMAIEFNDRCADLIGVEGSRTGFEQFERVERPAPKVLDADGVEIKLGDTVYDTKGEGHIVKEVYFDDDESHEHTVWFGEFKSGIPVVYIADQLIHTRPDSWERLERDAEKSICDYFGSSGSPDSLCEDGCPGLNSPVSCGVLMKLDLIRRAKALAEKEAAR